MLAIARDYMVALEMEGYVSKRLRIAVDVQRSHVVGTATAAMQLFAEEVGKVRGCS